MKNAFLITVLSLVTLNSVAATSPQDLVRLLEIMPPSYGFRRVCLSGPLAVGIYSTGKSWAMPVKTYIVMGDLMRFPKTQKEIDPSVPGSSPLSMNYPSGPEDWRNFPIIKQEAKGTGDTVYSTKGTITLNGRVTKADCAFEAGGRLE